MSANLFNRLGGAGNQLESFFSSEEAGTEAKKYAQALRLTRYRIHQIQYGV